MCKDIQRSNAIRDINHKIEIFARQTPTRIDDYLAAASTINEFRVEIAGGALGIQRLDEINQGIDSILEKFHINPTSPSK